MRRAAAVALEGLVFVEVDADPGQYLQEASYVAGLAERDPRILGMVAHAPLERGAAVTPDLEKLAAHQLTRAIRRLLQDEPDPEFCLRPGFVEGVKLLARFDLACDLCIRHHQLRGRDRARAPLPRGALRPRPHRQARDPRGPPRSLAQPHQSS